MAKGNIPWGVLMEAFLDSQRARLKGLAQEIVHRTAEIDCRRDQIKALRKEMRLERRALRSAEDGLAKSKRKG